MSACNICDISIYSGSRTEIIQIPSSYTQLNTVNLEFLYWAKRMKDFREALLNGLNVADGRWVQLLCRLKGKKVEHLPGSRIIYDFLSLADKEGLTVLFYGSTDDVLSQMREKISTLYPNVRAVYHNPGIITYPFSDDFLKRTTSLIRKTSPHLFFVALGPPLQEILIYRLRNVLEDAGTLLSMGVGGTFEMIAGVRRPAPRVVSSIGLEWLWHLLQRPNRWKKVKRSLSVIGWVLRRRC